MKEVAGRKEGRKKGGKEDDRRKEGRKEGCTILYNMYRMREGGLCRCTE
jgi:hypothetical protein